MIKVRVMGCGYGHLSAHREWGRALKLLPRGYDLGYGHFLQTLVWGWVL